MNEPSIGFRFRAAILSHLLALGLLAPVAAAQQGGSAAPPGDVLPVLPGKTISATVPLSAEEKTYAAIGGNRVPTNAVATLAAPPGFDPGNSWPVLVVFSTSDSHRENRGDIPFYITEALSEGWLVLTGDGPERPRDDSTGWRAAMTLAALDALHRSFPGSNKWPVACAGISGGAKRACLIAPLLAVKGNRVAGLYLAGVNEDLLGEGYRTFHPSRDFLSTKIFIISGQSDKIATPAQTERVMRSIRANGFRQVRLETFPEGHNVKRPLTVAALRWFHSGSSAVLPKAGTVAGSTALWQRWLCHPSQLRKKERGSNGALRSQLLHWIATAQTNGKTFQVRASSPALRDVAQERSQDSLKAMVADYEKRSAEPRRRD